MTFQIPAVGHVSILPEHDFQSAVRLASRDLRNVRADSRVSSMPTQFARAMIRNFADSKAAALVGNDRLDADVSDDAKLDVIAAIAQGLHLENRNDTIEDLGLRNDASYLFPGDGIGSTSSIIRPAEKNRALLASLSSRSIPANEKLFQNRWAGYEGSADVYREGMTSFPQAGANTAAQWKQTTVIVTTTHTPWKLALEGNLGGLNQVTEDAEAARRVLLDYLENALVQGIPGVADWNGAKDVPAPIYASTVDYSTVTNMDTVYADLIAMVQMVETANEFRGQGPSFILMGTRWIQRVQRLSNMNAGGASLGAQLLAMALEQAGVTGIIKAPSLTGQGPNGADANYDMAILWRPDPDGLRWINAMSPSPVRTVETIGGSTTLWAMAGGGLEAPRADSVGIAYAKVK